MGSYSYFNQTAGRAAISASTAAPTAPSSDFKPGLPGLLLNDFADNDQYSPSLSVGPDSSFADMGYYQNRLNPSTNVIFTAGKHTIVAGGGYSYTQLNITNNRNGYAESRRPAASTASSRGRCTLPT